MNKSLIVTLLLQLAFSYIHSQVKLTKELAREINEQIFDTDNFYPKTSVQTNKRFETLNGKIKKEIIILPDSTRIVNNYNMDGNLTLSKVLKKGVLRSTYSYEYKSDGKTLLKERGIYNLDYTVYEKDKYSTKYYAVKTPNTKQGLLYKYLDTLFINETKYSYEFIKQSNSKYNPVYEYRYKFKYNMGYLKQILVFKNDIKVGHFINNYNKSNQVISQELFWDYKWFSEDTGFPSVRNQIREIKYHNGLIKSIFNKSYNPTSRQWETTIKNYDCKLTKENKMIIANITRNNGENIIIKIDYNGNWISKSIVANNEESITKRYLEYYN